MNLLAKIHIYCLFRNKSAAKIYIICTSNPKYIEKTADLKNEFRIFDSLQEILFLS